MFARERERERECVRAYVRARARERVCVCERACAHSLFKCVAVCMSARTHTCMHARRCVSVREGEREKEGGGGGGGGGGCRYLCVRGGI